MNQTYAGIPDEYSKLENATTVLLTVPYDKTSTWNKGADKGPDAFLKASENMELYDIETNSEVYKNGIFLEDLHVTNDTPDVMVETVHDSVKKYLNKKKFVTLFGGEHSISIGAIRAFNEHFDNLSVLHIDAHADLRKSYEGSPYNHACAMFEASQNTNLIQVGIRSMDKSEMTVLNLEKTFFAHEMVENEYWMDEVVELLTDNVFISFDLDALDPSIFPSTGTPEPGGLLYYETLDFLKQVFKNKNVVGFDLVELCPNQMDKSSDFLAAKLYYKMLSYKFTDDSDNDEFEEDITDNNPFQKLSKFKSDEDNF